MADEYNIGDILSALSNADTKADNQQKTLDSIDKSLRLLLNDTRNMSATNAKATYGDDASTFFRSRSNTKFATGKVVSDILRGVDVRSISRTVTSEIQRNVTDKVDDIVTSFLDGFESQLLDGLQRIFNPRLEI